VLCLGVAWVLLAACSDNGSSAGTTVATAPATTVVTADPEHDVRVLGLWSGPELTSFETVKSAWEQSTGGTVEWTGARDLTGELHAQIAAGTPPDIAILPNVGLLHELAADGQLVPLASVLDMQQIQQDYSAPWLDLGSHDDELYGIFYKVNSKATVWYAPTAFAAAQYAVPSTWDEMIALADTMVADGRTPFSVVAPKVPGGGGWALTDWISQIVLDACGAELYDQWVAGEVPWTDACIRQSFERFDSIVQSPGYVLGGSERILATSDADGSAPMYTDPPDAYMYNMASFAQAFIAAKYPQLVAGDDYGFFPFPSIDPAHGATVTIGADVVVMLHDTPAARSFMTYLAGAESQRAWIELGGFTSVNRSVSADAYKDPVAREVADQLASADVIRFSAGDLMPAAVQQAWWKGMLQLVADPTTLDALLDSLTAVAAQT
jgi:alpha-glucoside transport system substrate-binding protein